MDRVLGFEPRGWGFDSLRAHMTTQTVKDIQSVDSLRPVNKGKFGVSVDKSGDMCIKGQKSLSFMLHM